MTLLRIGGLALFSRTNSRGHWILASYHSPHSLTWSWSIRISRTGRPRHWRCWWACRNNYGLQWSAWLPWLFGISWSRQRPMYYRDLYRQMRDERDGLTARPQPTPPAPLVVVHSAPERMQ